MTQITESSKTLKQSGGRWNVLLVSPGKGSSGVYAEEMLRSTGPGAFPKGTHSYVDHTTDGRRNPRDLFGVLSEDAHYEDGVGLVGVLDVLPHWRDFANAVAPHVGMSIFANAERSQDPATGEWVVESILPAIDNAIDLVSYPGRGGQLLDQLAESARSSFDFTTSSVKEDSGTAPAESRNQIGKEKVSMEIDELATRVDKLAESLETLAALIKPLAESITSAEQEKVAKEAEESKTPELDFAKIAEAAVAAGLPHAAREVVYTEVRLGGASVEESIARQKQLVDEIRESAEKTYGATVRVGSDSINQDFSVARWGR